MNIMLIGNGFDLAHGLPTKYDNFLDFIDIIEERIEAFNSPDILNYHFHDRLDEIYNDISDSVNKKFLELSQNGEYIKFWEQIITNNIWIDYFKASRPNMKKNWIDFEREIFFVVSNLDSFIQNNPVINFSQFFSQNDFLDDFSRNYRILLRTYNQKNKELTIPAFIHELEKDLEKLIYALEIYINEFVNKFDVKYYSKQIASLNIDKVISFNYSNTFETVYGPLNHNTQYDYVHGKASYHSEYTDNKIVLRINEYLDNDERNTNTRFIRFKKFFQRIHKNTGCNYKSWLKEIDNNGGKHNLYIFGHSLDVTDQDILRELILHDNIKTTIFYHDKEAYAQQIINLVEVIEQDNLIKRAGGINKSIYFVKQADFKSELFSRVS